MKISNPRKAIAIYLGIGFLVYVYGLPTGSFVLFDIIAGIVLYTIISN